jgi:hypothetical protein
MIFPMVGTSFSLPAPLFSGLKNRRAFCLLPEFP